MSSISDVASLAGVSPATASRVMSGSTYPVRDATRERVVDAAKTLGFLPNQLARGLVTNRTNIVAAIVHDISDPYFAEVVRALGDVARAHGYQLLASSTDRDATAEIEWLEVLLSYRVDGLIFASSALRHRSYNTELKRLLARFEEEERAVVRCASHLSSIRGVTINQRRATEEATRYLIELGHERIGYIAGPRSVRAAYERRQGYERALEKAGLPREDDLVVEGGFTGEGGVAAVAELLRQRPDVTAVFAANDVMAIGALHGLLRAGIRVPDDLSLMGFNDVKMSRYVSPSLTTVHVPIREQAEQVFAMLLAELDGQQPRSTELPTRIITRESTATARSCPELPVDAVARVVALAEGDDRG